MDKSNEDERRWTVFGAWAGFAYVAITIIAWIVFWKTQGFTHLGSPPANASPASLASFYAKHRTIEQVAAAVFSLALLPLAFFYGRLYSVLRRAEGGSGTGSNIFLMGAIGGIAVPIMYYTGFFGVAYRAGQTSPAITQYNHDLLILPASAGGPVWVAMFLGIAIVVLKNHALPRWLGLAAVPVGLCQFLYIGGGFTDTGAFNGTTGFLVAYLAFGTYMGWIVATSVCWNLVARHTPPEERRERTPASLSTASAAGGHVHVS